MLTFDHGSVLNPSDFLVPNRIYLHPKLMNHHRLPLNVTSALHPLVTVGMQTLIEGLAVGLVVQVARAHRLAQGEI